MKASDIITLLSAGYTKAEIDAMDQPEPVQAPQAAEPEHAEPAKDQPEPTKDQHEPAKDQPEPANDHYAKLEALLTKFLNVAQAGNLNANMAGAVPSKDTTDILAAVIAPPQKKSK